MAVKERNMERFEDASSPRVGDIRRNQGFTLVELLISLVLAMIVTAGVYAVYAFEQRSYRDQQLSLEARQNLRGAMIMLEQQLRMAGYDPNATRQFGITDVRRYDPTTAKPDAAGQPALAYTVDFDENGRLDLPDGDRGREHPVLSIRRDEETGRPYLSWDAGQGPQPLAQNIEALGFAYAIDRDRQGRPETWAGGQHTIWAVDTDNDNLLDTHIDANDDGVIDLKDDTDGDNKITAADGAPLQPPVPLDRIKAVRVWILSASARPLQGHVLARPYLVGDRIIPAADDGIRREVLQTTIECRNL